MATGRAPVKLPFPPKDFGTLTPREQESLYLDFQALADQADGTRWGTIVIAPSDATTASKAKADVVLDAVNDTARVNAAIAGITNRAQAGRVVFLEGTVYLTTPLLATATSYLKIEGQGHSTKLTATGNGMNLTNGTVEVSNLWIQTGATGIATNATNLYMDRVKITGGTVGVEAFGASVFCNALITNCTISASSRGLRMLDMWTCILSGNDVSGVTSGGRGIDLNANSGFLVKSIVTGNTVTGAGTWGIDCNNGSADSTDVKQTIISSNKVIGGWSTGIAFNGNDGVLVQGNLVNGAGTGLGIHAIGITHTAQVFVTGNFFQDCTGVGVSVSASTIGTSDFSVCFNKIKCGPGATKPSYAITVGGSVQDAAVAFNDTWSSYSVAAVSDSGTNTRREDSFFSSGLSDVNARVGVRANSTGSTYLRRRLNFIPSSADFVVSLADDSTNEEVDITLGLGPTVDANARVGVRKNSTGSTSKRRRVNFIEGSSITITVADDAVDEEVDVTIAVSGGSGFGDTEGQIVAQWDGAGTTIDSARTVTVVAPFAGTIDRWEILADQTDTVSVEVWKDVYANYPPTIADKITASAPITLTASPSNASSTLTGWATGITAGDVFLFKINTLGAARQLTVLLHYTRP